jgi:hypothetical protein
MLVLLVAGMAMSSSLPAQQEPMPDFHLADVNPGSLRYADAVSPRDYRLQISAYYFGAAG